MSDIKAEKSALRKRIIALRDNMPESARDNEVAMVSEKLDSIGLFNKKRNVLIFLSYGSEIDTNGIIDKLIENGSKVYVPRVNPETNNIDICRFTRETKLVPERHGILEPDSSVSAEDPTIIDVIINPGVAFTSDCKRLGYGGGYYDRMFEYIRQDAIKIGICYDLQIVESLPVEIHDMRMDYVVTASEIF